MADTRLTGLLRHLHAAPGPAAPPADRDALAAFVARRDGDAFAALVHRHGPMVYQVCRRVLHHAQDAEDAFQATFLVLARKAGTVGRAEALPSWLHGVAFRTALRARRDAGRRRLREQQAPTGTGPDPAEDLAWRDVQTLLEAEIRRLPERYRGPFVLCHLEGRSRAEAAIDLGLSENTLSSRLARARDRLRRRLARRGVHLSAVLAAAALSADAAASALPTEFFLTTIRAGMRFAARQPVTGVTGHTLQLTSGALTTMAVARMKWAAGVFAVGGLLAAGTWGAGQVPGGPRGQSPPPAAGEPPAEKPLAGGRLADQAQRKRSLDNIKQILLAMHAYHEMHNRLPADITDKTGKPLLSWRVELLPFVEQDGLSRQFKRDEPWDSPHNLRLLAKMPDVFRVSIDPKDATHTYYQRFAIMSPAPADPRGGGADGPAGGEGGGGAAPPGVGLPPGPGAGGIPPAGGGPAPPVGLPGMPGGGLGGPLAGPAAGPPPGLLGEGGPAAPRVARFPLQMHEVTDGTSNTIGVIEAGPPVPWTKPADLVYDATKPLPVITGPYTNVRHAGMLDGTAVAFRPKLDEKTWRQLIDPSDGEALRDWNTLRARFPADSADEKKALAKVLADNANLIAAVEAQLREHAALLQLAKDGEGAAEQADELKQLLEALKAKNRKLREELGLRAGGPAKP